MSGGKKPSQLHRQLGRELTVVRNLAGLEQRELGAAIGLTQAMVSRAERGLKVLPLPKIRAWAQACDAAPDTLERLLALTESAFTQVESWTDLLAETSQLQDAVRADEATARVLLSYTRTVVPGLLQTSGYAEHVLRLTNYTGEMDEAAALAARWRRQEALTDQGRRFEFVIAEAVLRWAPGGRADVLARQLDRIATVAGQENVLLGVVASGSEPVLPFHDFTIYDGRDDGPLVVTELAHSYMTLMRTQDVALYQDMFGQLREAAVKGPDAVAVLKRVATELRG